MKKTVSRLIVFPAVFAMTLAAQAAMTTVEGFESYSSSAALQSAWTIAAGAPLVTLEHSIVCQGTNAMAFAYSGTSAPFTNLVQLTFGSSQNWSSNTVFTFNYGGVGCSNDAVMVQFLDQFGGVLGTYQFPGGTLSAPCSVATVDFANGPAFTNITDGTGLQSVSAIQLGVVAGAAADSGTLYFDNLQVGNRGVLSVLGSSVALGYWATGASNNTYVNGSFVGSYAALLTAEEASNGWWVVNQSVAGDDTADVIGRFYTDEVPVGADEDAISLSLGNEGLPGATDPLGIYNQYFAGITNLIAMSRSNNILPLVGNNYPRDTYTADEYVYLKSMDLLLNTLNVPSINFLGATDDGSGHWVSNSFITLGHGDGIHPNNFGHYEMFLTIVPSVFDALKSGKPTPQWGSKSQFLRIFGDAGQAAPLSLTPSLIMHSFSVSFRVRSTNTGTVASVTLPASSVHPTVEITATGFAYMGTNGVLNNSGISGTDGAWHDIVVAHEYSRGETWFYVDGVLASTVAEHLTPVGFVLGGHGSAVTRPGSPAQADYENWFVHRSMLNAEEVNAQFQGNLQQASLELYAPLNDNSIVQGGTVTNVAQSYSTAQINGPAGDYLSAQSLPPPSNLVLSSNYTPAMILNWTDPASAAENAYYVNRRVVGGPWTNIATLAAHSTSYSDATVGIGTVYQYRVSYSLSGLESDYALSATAELPQTNYVQQTILIDFGPNDGTNGNITPSPDVNGNYWNNMTSPYSVPDALSISNLVTTNNSPTTVGVGVTSTTWLDNGILSGGLLNPNSALLGIFAIPTVTEDYFFVQGSQGTAGTLQISGLNPLLTYNLFLFGTRNTSSVRTTGYSVSDVNGTHSTNLVTSGAAANSGTNPSDTAGNDKTIVSLNGLVPNESGDLTLTVTVADSGGFAYLGALEIISVASGPVFTVNPLTQTDVVGATNTLTAIAASSLPVNYQWYFASTNAPTSFGPIPGATGTNLVLANEGYANAGSYYVVASSSLGSATSAVAVVTIIAPSTVSAPAQSILIDFGPDGVSNTDGAPTPSPDVNGNYWNNMDETAYQTVITNLVTANDTASTVGVTITSATWADNGITHGGLLNPNPALLGFFAIPTVTEDYFFVQGAQGTTGTMLISGLNPAAAYNLSMFGTRNTNQVRTSTYSVVDANGLHSVNLQTSGTATSSGTNPSDTAGNDETIVSLDALVPNASGQLTLTLAIADSGGYAYIGAMEIALTGPAPTFAENPQSQTFNVGSTNTLTALALSSQPINYQWYFANTNAPASYSLVSGATGTNLVLAKVGFTNAGSYYCVASNSLGTATSAVAVITVIAPAANSNQTLLIDLGPNDGANGNITGSPDVNGNYWNNITNGANGSSITNLVTTNNVLTTVALTVSSNSFAGNGIQNGGLLNPNPALLGIFAIATATEDYFYINQTYGTAAGTSGLLISGLNPLLAYNLSMFATRNTATARVTTYSVTDVNGTHSTNLTVSGSAANSGSNSSDTQGNDETIVSLSGLVPNAAGQLTLDVAVGNSQNYAYLGILMISQSPSKPAFAVNPVTQTDRVGTTNTLTASAVGTLPITYQWYFAGSNAPGSYNAVSGATGTNLVLANVGYGNGGNYYCVASNSLGTTTSAVAAVSIVSLHVPAQSILIDFGPDGVSNTDGAPTSSPDGNGNYWNNMDETANGTVLTNLVTANDAASTVSVTLTSSTWANNGITHGGLLSPNAALLGDFAIATVTEDYFYIQNTGTTGTFEISGLNPALAYNLSMFATRTTSATDTRNSIYSVTDVNGTHSVTLQTSGPGSGSAANPYGNDQTIVSLNGLVPNTSGQLNFTASIGANTGSAYAYVGALEIAYTGPAPQFTVNPQSQTNGVGATVTLNALATNTLPISYQWYFANSNAPSSYNVLSGATGTNLVLANLGSTNAGNYYCVASNSLGTATSAVATVTIVPPSASSLLLPSVTAGGWKIQFSGTPGAAYYLQRATNVSGPWTNLGTVISPANGLCIYNDTNAPSGQAYYRTVAP